MSEEFNSAACSASDCATCGENCSQVFTDPDKVPHTISLTLDDDTEMECAVLTVFPVGEKEYIALLPLKEDGQPLSGDVYLYSFTRTEKGDPMLANIEDDEEYRIAGETFNKVVENAMNAEKAGQPIE